ncbi:MAG TPA: hypothetical protein VK945_04135 [Planococcus sp. (in: firmicutes)]|nr:hypothetical protein [Planococcus sp. (in: firmicutes)]
MEPRRSRKEFRKTKHLKETGLSYGVANVNAKPLDREGNKFLEFLMHVFLFILGGIILAGMLIAVLTIS